MLLIITQEGYECEGCAYLDPHALQQPQILELFLSFMAFKGILQQEGCFPGLLYIILDSKMQGSTWTCRYSYPCFLHI